MPVQRIVLVAIGLVAAVASSVSAQVTVAGPASRPVPRADENSRLAHLQLVEKTRQGRIDLYFAGDSITRRWGATDYPDLLAHWTRRFHGWNAANFGWGGDATQHILWRLENGELDGIDPRVIVLLAGTNNIGTAVPADPDAAARDVATGIEAILGAMHARVPRATIILMAVFPRRDNRAVMPTIDRLNQRLAALADGAAVRFLDINRQLSDERGRLLDAVSVDGLHLTTAGYQVWADALEPLLTELLGPRAAEDHAPPATGNPAAR